MNTIIESIEETLRNQLAELDGQSCQLKQDLKGVEDGRKRIAAALSALGAKTTRAKRSKARDCCTREEVATIVKTILEQNTEVPINDLEALAKDKITETGKSLSGFALRFKEVLRSGLVHECQPDVYRLGSQ